MKYMSDQVFVLGAGMTGLAAGAISGFDIFEASALPGGICSSYYVLSSQTEHMTDISASTEAYRFERGGGHWIFGGDPAVLRFIRNAVQVRSYSRRSSVFFSRDRQYVPYPLQNHLSFLARDIAIKALGEMARTNNGIPSTMADWLEQSFGKTLCDLFFAPFHSLYTAGLWTRIAPQDSYKSPAAFEFALKGAFDETPPVGYNSVFVYPVNGLNSLAEQMAKKCHIKYGKKAVRIKADRKELQFADGSGMHYGSLISTLPLNQMIEIAAVEVDEEPDPYTSVLVLNIGATRSTMCPIDHWLYVPDSCSGFHRVGFYSNVDSSFLPATSRESKDRVGIYVERAYRGGERPSDSEIFGYSQAAVKELQEWGFIHKVEVLDPTWIDVAYTWSWPGSKWKQRALRNLEENDIFQVGRYGRWLFQGIADSMRDGFAAGGSFC